MMIIKGITVIQSSHPAIRLPSITSSGEVRKYIGRYHKWHKAIAAKKIAVQRRRRTGGEKDIYKNEYAGHCIWTKENNVFGWGKLIEGQAKALTDEEMIYFSPAMATVEQLKGLPETFMIVGSLDLFCDEDMSYAQKLMEAGIFTELYVEPGVPHAYEYLEWTPQAHRFSELRNHATARMLGAEKNVEESAEAKAFRELLLKYNMEQ